METHYSILEITESATSKEITQAYRLLLQVWHPDRFHHSPTLLAKAEQRAGKINAAFETLSNPASKQRYDDGLRSSRARNAEIVGTVTCPSCRTTFRSNPERNEGRDNHYPDRHRAAEESDQKSDPHPNYTAGATPQDNESVTPVRMAMLAIAVLFAVVLVFTFTKKSKIIVSNKPAQTDEQATLPMNEPLVFKEEEQVHHAEAAQDGVSNTPTQTDQTGTLPRKASTAETKQERPNGLEAIQRQMAQAFGRASASPADMISDVDLRQLRTLAAQGHASAQSQLGQLYDSGRRGVPQDYAAARGWYEKAAAQGHAWAQNQLGQLYADGRGVPQDYTKARQWWEQAAAQGVAQAQYNLGQLYVNGRGVPQDYTTARGWHEKAAAQGHAWAQAQLGQLYANGWGVPQDYATARGWYGKAAAQGNAWAQAQLALL
jgi:TPR repeat protein